VLGPPTGATCPPTSTLTYASFGQAFMESYCTRCHSSTLTGAARNGATAFHDFDTRLGVLQVADHVDQSGGSGPTRPTTRCARRRHAERRRARDARRVDCLRRAVI